jgi:hypothetical protein
VLLNLYHMRTEAPNCSSRSGLGRDVGLFSGEAMWEGAGGCREERSGRAAHRGTLRCRPRCVAWRALFSGWPPVTRSEGRPQPSGWRMRFSRRRGGVAEVLAKPYVIVRMHPAAVEAVERHLREHDLTVVCLDPRLGERVQVFAGDRFAGRIRVVLADDAEALARIGPDEPVLVSGAVAERLERDFNFVVNPRTPAFDPPSARELARVLIRLNLEAAEARRQERGV